MNGRRLNGRFFVLGSYALVGLYASVLRGEIRPEGHFEDGVVSVVYRQGDGNVSIVGDGHMLSTVELVSTANDFVPPRVWFCDGICFGNQTKVFELQSEAVLQIDLGPRAVAHLEPSDIAKRWTVTGATVDGEIDSTESGGASVDLIVLETDLPGDFSSNGLLDPDDMDILSHQARSPVANPNFDLNGDTAVSQADREFWLHEYAKTWYGDSNLDGLFNSTDFLQVFAAAEYNDLLEDNSSWSTGDWNGDGDFGTSDLIVAFQDGGYETHGQIQVRPTVSVPESKCNASIVCAVALLFVRIRRLIKS